MTEAESFRARTEFVIELSRRLHAYGTTSQRLEAAVGKVARRLGLACEIWANPTGIIISFGGGIGEGNVGELRRGGGGDVGDTSKANHERRGDCVCL